MTNGKSGSATAFGWFTALLLSALLAGCGGGGGGGSATTTVEGAGAFGKPIVGGTVQMVCAGNNPGTTVITSPTGGFAVTAPGSSPCVIKISGGNLVGGPFYSVFLAPAQSGFLSAAQPRVNVNQLTTVLAGMLAGGNPESFFTSPGTIATKITAALVATHKAKITADVITARGFGTATGTPAAFDFLETPFVADGTKFDKLLDNITLTFPTQTSALITLKGTGETLFAVNATGVTSTPGSTPILAVNLVGAAGTGTPVTPATTKAITAYSLAHSAGTATGTITGAATPFAIAVTVPNATPLTALVATFTTTGASVKVDTAAQTSGTTANNFTTSPVAYIVTAADGSTATYNVTVTVAAAIIPPPTVSSTGPTDGATGVSTRTAGPGTAVTGKQVAVTFSEPMDTATLISDPAGTLLTFTLKVTGGADVPGTVAMATGANSTTRAIFKPSDPTLLEDTNYTATVTTAAKNASGIAMANPVVWSFQTGFDVSSPAQQSQVRLGTASTYGVFASADAAVTLVDNSTGTGSLVTGNVGLMDGLGTCNGCDTTTVSGVIDNGIGTPAEQAQLDFRAAYDEASVRNINRCTVNTTELGMAQGACTGYVVVPGTVTTVSPVTAPTYKPGLYWSGSTIMLGVDKTIILNAGGNADAVFIFQAGSAITMNSGSKVILANGALAKNVWWIAGSDATLGISSTFSGTVITLGSSLGIVVTAGSTAVAPTLVEGRLLSGAAVTVPAFTTVTVPAP